MLRLFFYAALVSVGCAYVIPPRAFFINFPAPIPSAGRIVGGEEVSINDVSHQVSIYRLDKFWCGGSIVKANAIVTAAHCTFFFPTSEFTVRAGSRRLDFGGTKLGCKRIFNHERYPIGLLDYDIAIIQLSRDIILGESTSAIALPRQGLKVHGGSMALASGWGRTSFGGSTSNILRKVEIPIVDHELCKKAYGRILTRHMICAGYFEEGGKGTCIGDSGGPLVFNYTLIGVTSWGYGCAYPGYPGVFARVPEFRNWLDEKLSQFP